MEIEYREQEREIKNLNAKSKTLRKGLTKKSNA